MALSSAPESGLQRPPLSKEFPRDPIALKNACDAATAAIDARLTVFNSGPETIQDKMAYNLLGLGSLTMQEAQAKVAASPQLRQRFDTVRGQTATAMQRCREITISGKDIASMFPEVAGKPLPVQEAYRELTVQMRAVEWAKKDRTNTDPSLTDSLLTKVGIASDRTDPAFWDAQLAALKQQRAQLLTQ